MVSTDDLLQQIEDHVRAVRTLQTHLARPITDAANLAVWCLREGGKLLFCGNGGSAADAQHFAAEFVGRFVAERRGMPAIALTTDSSVLTAVANDYGYDQVFARQVQALGREGDVLFAISTSGNSPSIVQAVTVARSLGMRSIGLLGRNGGSLQELVDIAITVPVTDTARIQECHELIGHMLCAAADAELAPSWTTDRDE